MLRESATADHSGAVHAGRVSDPLPTFDTALALTSAPDRDVRRLAWAAVAALGALMAAAGWGRGREAAMLSLPVLRPVVGAASDLCYETFCASITDLAQCIACCDTHCAYNLAVRRQCEDKCLAHSGSVVSGLAGLKRRLDLSTGDEAQGLAERLVWHAENNEDMRARAFALALASDNRMSAAMLGVHNEQGDRR